MKFCEKNVLCEKGDEITRFDGIMLNQRRPFLHNKLIITRSLLFICGFAKPRPSHGRDEYLVCTLSLQGHSISITLATTHLLYVITLSIAHL